jgi:2-polyprenyl-3-methyl-5-hydroxy-6-metoxy-1,4-benzoquinol methylase
MPSTKKTTTASAEFSSRNECIGCRSRNLEVLSTGRYYDEPMRSIIANDPWGENPLPYLEGKSWTYVRCRDCRTAFQRDILNPEWNEIRFSRWMTADAIKRFEDAIQTPETRFQAGKDRVRHVLAIEALTRSIRDGAVRVLDFGCGSGAFLETCLLHGFGAVGVDRSTARHELAHLPIHESLNGVSGKFDAVTLFEVLEHLDDPRSILEALRGYLRTGGLLILETPDTTGVTDIKSREACSAIFPLDHINGFTPVTLTAFAQRLGFTPIPRPVAQINCELRKALKTEAKRVLSRFLPRTTQQYFRKS